MRAVIFTGAGAGRADGVPTQTELFRAFFSASAQSTGSREILARDVAAFFAAAFSVDPLVNVSAPLPTFEEALGILDLALTRDEALARTDQFTSRATNLRAMRRQLVLALAATVARDRHSVPAYHGQLVRSLREGGVIENITFVTTNYDTLIDDAIDAEAVGRDRGTGSLVDYGLSDLAPPVSTRHSDPRAFPCLKIHGSLNWLHCPLCDILDITHASDGVTRLVDEPDGARCLTCETMRTPVIVPPSYYKDMSSVHLAVVWNKASRALQAADRLVFAGYSFPAADFHVKYLLKRAQMNRDRHAQPLRVLLANQYPNKPGAEATAEYDRYARFLGVADLVDTRRSFQEVAEDPLSTLNL